MSRLEKFIKESELEYKHIAQLEPCLAGLWTINDFNNIWRRQRARTIYGNAFGLQGDDTANTPYTLACKAFSIRHCQDFGQSFGFSYQRNASNKILIEKQMNVLKSVEEPIVFFVPPNLVTHPKVGKTYEEMVWLWDNAKDAPKTHLVFGLYDFIAYPYIYLLATTRRS